MTRYNVYSKKSLLGQVVSRPPEGVEIDPEEEDRLALCAAKRQYGAVFGEANLRVERADPKPPTSN